MSTPPLDRAQLLATFEQQSQTLAAATVLFQQAVAEQLAINATDLHCGNLIRMIGPMTAGQLAELTGLTSGAITGVIDRLEKAGYVQRAQDATDRRRVIVQANVDTMMHKISPFYDSIGRASDAIIARYSDAELALLVDFFAQMNATILQEAAQLRQNTGADDSAAKEISAETVDVPLAGVDSGHLVCTTGATHITISGDPALGVLFHAHFGKPTPRVFVQGGLVKIHYQRRRSLLEWGASKASITLNSAIPWRIDLLSAGAACVADLRAVQLSALDINGTASSIDVSLPRPESTVPFRVAGNASSVVIRRPADVAVHVHLRRASSSLKLDGQQHGPTSGKPLQTLNYAHTRRRYDIDIAGRASAVVIETDDSAAE